MKTAPLIIVLLIGLGILGYVFLNKQNTNTDINNNFSFLEEENNTPIIPNNNTGTQTNTNTNTQTPPVMPPSINPTPTNPPVTTTPLSNPPVAQGGGSDCTPNDPPSVTLISPNGGEVFQSGQQITVIWKSCNVSQNDNVAIDLFHANNLNGGNCVLNGQTSNDTMETVNLNISGCQYLDFQSGANYKTRVYLLNSPVGTIVQDFSDNSFIIN